MIPFAVVERGCLEHTVSHRPTGGRIQVTIPSGIVSTPGTTATTGVDTTPVTTIQAAVEAARAIPAAASRAGDRDLRAAVSAAKTRAAPFNRLYTRPVAEIPVAVSAGAVVAGLTPAVAAAILSAAGAQEHRVVKKASKTN